MAEELYDLRMKMHMFVELRMSLIAPNLCRIIGAGTAAMLVSQAGGLSPLAKMPACNVLILGLGPYPTKKQKLPLIYKLRKAKENAQRLQHICGAPTHGLHLPSSHCAISSTRFAQKSSQIAVCKMHFGRPR
jgi:hypothetical protein